MKSNRLCFIGCMGSGKSSLARRYTAKYGGEVFDVDKEFAKLYGDISTFFATRGEAEFRRLEEQLMISAARGDYAVVSTGGGAVLSKRGMAALRAVCEVVFLSAPQQVLKARIEKSDRPLKTDLERVLRERMPLYEKYADYTVDSSVDSLSELEKALTFPRSRRYDVVLCDSDNTLLDFTRASAWAVEHTLSELGVKCDPERAVALYRPIVKDVWEKLERGEISRNQLFDLREDAFAAALGTHFERGAFNGLYRAYLRETRFVKDGAIEFLQQLKARGVAVYIITNADVYCASQRLKPIVPYVDGAFISEALGVNKPDVGFFEEINKRICLDRSRTIVFGDSPTADIKGAVDYGLDSCLFDPSGKLASDADYTAACYDDFLAII